MAGHAYHEGTLWKFMRGLGLFPKRTTDAQNGLNRAAVYMRDNQPTAPVLGETMVGIANNVGRSLQDFQRLAARVHAEAERDRRRVDQPRKGSRGVEAKADAGARIRDPG
jgi:hypothetical protein